MMIMIIQDSWFLRKLEKVALDALISVLENQDAMLDAIESLKFMVEKGFDVSSAIPILTKVLENETDTSVRQEVLHIFMFAVEKGSIDISVSTPTLIQLLGSEDIIVRKKSEIVLQDAALSGSKEMVDALVDALEHEDKGVRKNAAEALSQATSKGTDVSIHLSKLINLLRKGSPSITHDTLIPYDIVDIIRNASFTGKFSEEHLAELRKTMREVVEKETRPEYKLELRILFSDLYKSVINNIKRSTQLKDARIKPIQRRKTGKFRTIKRVRNG